MSCFLSTSRHQCFLCGKRICKLIVCTVIPQHSVSNLVTLTLLRPTCCPMLVTCRRRRRVRISSSITLCGMVSGGLLTKSFVIIFDTTMSRCCDSVTSSVLFLLLIQKDPMSSILFTLSDNFTFPTIVVLGEDDSRFRIIPIWRRGVGARSSTESGIDDFVARTNQHYIVRGFPTALKMSSLCDRQRPLWIVLLL